MNILALWAGTAEYTDCVSVDPVRHSQYECLGYDIKQFDEEAPVMQKL